MIKDLAINLEGGYDLKYPRLVPVRQKFNATRIGDIPGAVCGEFAKLSGTGLLRPGIRVAVAVGSRGIANLKEIVKTTINELQALGTHPFIVPAMGSHGGATAAGQEKVLASYGITQEEVGVPVCASMEVIQVGTWNGYPLYYDQAAAAADVVFLINRIKPHTDFKGSIESGLLKMVVIGLGNHRGATIMHSLGFDRFHQIIPEAGAIILANTPPTIGLAVLENAYDETAKIEILLGEEILIREPELLAEAKGFMPRLLLPTMDVLIVDEIGKDISGAGMDPNIIGRTPSGLTEGFDAPPIQRIVVLDLTEKTHGNAMGIGMADVTTRKLVEKIDFAYTYANALTSTVLIAAKIPMFFNTEKEAIAVAVKTCNRVDPEKARIVRIKNTLELSHVLISETYLPLDRADLEITGEPFPLEFDALGNLYRTW